MNNPFKAVQLQATIYESRNETRRWLHQTRKAHIAQLIERYGTGSLKAMEIGPGSGVYLPILCETSKHVTAIDIHAGHLEVAKGLQHSLPNLDVVECDVIEYRSEESFDLILCSEVIEHLVESESTLASLASLLSDDGFLILSTPQRYSTLEVCAKVAFLPGILQIVRLAYREAVEPLGHINLLTEKQLNGQTERAGFVTVESFKSGFYLPIVAELMGKAGRCWLQSMEHTLRGERFSWLSSLLWTQYRVLKKRHH